MDYPPPQHPGSADERPPGPHATHRCRTLACVRDVRAGDTVVLVRDLRGTLRLTRGFVRVTGDVTVDRVVVRRASGVVLRGLTVRDGVLVRDARDPVLRDLDVRGGIRLLRVRGGTVTRVVARGPQAALSVEATPDQVRPRRTMLRHVTLRDSPVGLRLVAARWLTATGLAFSGNGADTQADAATGDVFGV
jgi:hypothetical protein